MPLPLVSVNDPDNQFNFDRIALQFPLGDITSLKTVKDFGAKGDGTTDDTAAFTAALNAATGTATTASDAANSGTVIVPPGVYIVSDAAFTARAQTLLGLGWGATLKAKSGATYALRCEGHSRCKVQNLSIEGNGRASHGLLVQASTTEASEQFSMERVRIADCNIGLHIGPGAGAITQVDKNLYVGCHFSANTTGAKIDSINGQEQVFIQADFYNGLPFASAVGINLVNGSLTMIGSQLQTAGTQGIVLGGGTIEWVNLKDTIFEGQAIDIDGSTYWPRNGLKLEQCVLSGTSNTVKMGTGVALSVLHATFTRFLTGVLAVSANDAVFHDAYNEFASGATVSVSGSQFRRPQWSANGLTMNANELLVAPITSARTALTLRGEVGQSANMMEQRDSSGNVKSLLTAGGGFGSALVAAGTVLGSVVNKMPVYDQAGTLKGYLPIYNTIT